MLDIMSLDAITMDKRQNKYFESFYKSHVKEELKTFYDLPKDVRNYMLDNFHQPYFSHIQIGEKNVDKIKKIPSHVIGVYLYGKIDKIPEYVLNNKNIVFFDCSFSEVKSFPKHKFFEQLIFFNCSHTETKRLPENLYNTIVIDARYAQLVEIPPKETMTKVKHINLTNNRTIGENDEKKILDYYDNIEFVFR